MRISDWSSDVCSSDLPQAIASRAFARLLYGTHPYATQPTVASIEAITRDDLLAFHATHYVANHAVIAMIGDITRAQAQQIADELTRRLPQGATQIGRAHV